LLGDLLRHRVDIRLRRGNIGARLIERRLIIARIDAGVPNRLDRLVVVDRDLGGSPTPSD
jgi:hypothetical protein